MDTKSRATIDVKDEMEFKLWLKFIVSVHKSGGDIKKPVDILWKSIEEELKFVNSKNRISKKRKIAA